MINRYFTNGRVIEQGQDHLIKDDWIEVENPVKKDGTFYKRHKSLKLLERKDGELKTYYISSFNEKGFYPIDWDKERLKEIEGVKVTYKSYYLELFEAKLKELDYDSIATLSMWANKDNSEFQEEAKILLDWYDLLVTKNYEILNGISDNSMQILSKEDYLSILPAYE